jgi:hypothetical protein
VKPSGDVLRARDWEVRDVDMDTCYELVRALHYAKGGSNTGTYMHGLFHKSNFMQCLGVAWWIQPTKTAAQANWGGDPQRVIALSRLVIAPGVPKNAATFLQAQSIKRIKADGRYDCLLTYADTWQGHTGAIYRAANWEYLGLTKPEPMFVTRDGVMVSRKAGPKTRTRKQMEELGYSMVGKYAKHRFRMILREAQ